MTFLLIGLICGECHHYININQKQNKEDKTTHAIQTHDKV
jgi:hypothetical protein